MRRSLLGELAADRRARVMFLLLVPLVTLVVRAATLGTYSLMDTTEARYGEIARLMLSTGDWITPHEYPGIPFWAKPPLYAWLSAGSMALFGINEMAARLPSFVCAVAMALVVFSWARCQRNAEDELSAMEAGLMAVAVLSTSVLFYTAAGAVMTDPSLALATTWMLAAFNQTVIHDTQRFHWRWGFFFAAGLAMLAKGPVLAIYAGLPIVVWMAWTGRWADVWRRLPWLRGGLVFASVWLPWYVAAEFETPGFLSYFVVGEHFMRYLHPGWSGDAYGHAHRTPVGAIWLFMLAGLGLWGPLAGGMALARLRRARPPRIGDLRTTDESGWLFTLLCVVVPLGAFTFARNSMWTYVLPMLGPAAVLLSGILFCKLGHRAWERGLLAATLIAWATLAVGWIVWAPRVSRDRSAAPLVEMWQQEAANEHESGPLYFWGTTIPHSVRFYARGEVNGLDLGAGMRVPDRQTVFLIVERERAAEVRQWVRANLPESEFDILAGNKRFLLAEIEPFPKGER